MAETLLDLNAMLDSTLDAFPDIPDYITPPPGEYQLEVKDCAVDTYTNKLGVKSQRIKITYSIVETVAVAEGSQPVPNGSLFTETFTATEQGISFFKNRVKSILEVDNLAGVRFSDIINSCKGAVLYARLSIKKTPNPNGGEYENVHIRVIPGRK